MTTSTPARKKHLDEMLFPVQPTKLFIGGIHRDTTTQQLREHFSPQYGNVLDCVAMKDRKTNRARCFGFVTLSSPEAAERCIRTPQNIGGRVVEMKRAEPEASPKRPQTLNLDKEFSETWPKVPKGGNIVSRPQTVVQSTSHMWNSEVSTDVQSLLLPTTVADSGRHHCTELVNAAPKKSGRPKATPVVPSQPERPPMADITREFSNKVNITNAANKSVPKKEKGHAKLTEIYQQDDFRRLSPPRTVSTTLNFISDSPIKVKSSFSMLVPMKCDTISKSRLFSLDDENPSFAVHDDFAGDFPACEPKNPNVVRPPPGLGLFVPTQQPNLQTGNHSSFIQEHGPLLAFGKDDSDEKETSLLLKTPLDELKHAKPSEPANKVGQDFDKSVFELPEGCPSVGSLLHEQDECRRCNFIANGRCKNGEACRFCHYPHVKRKPSRQEKRDRKAQWEQQKPAIHEGSEDAMSSDSATGTLDTSEPTSLSSLAFAVGAVDVGVSVGVGLPACPPPPPEPYKPLHLNLVESTCPQQPWLPRHFKGCAVGHQGGARNSMRLEAGTQTDGI